MSMKGQNVLSYSNGMVMELPNELHIPVPDGYHYESSGEGVNSGWVYIVSEGVSLSENHIDAKGYSFGIVSELTAQLDFESCLLEDIKQIFVSRGILDSSVQVDSLLVSEHCAFLYQNWVDPSDKTYNKINGFLFAGGEVRQFHVFINHDDEISHDEKTIKAFLEAARTWMGQVTLAIDDVVQESCEQQADALPESNSETEIEKLCVEETQEVKEKAYIEKKPTPEQMLGILKRHCISNGKKFESFVEINAFVQDAGVSPVALRRHITKIHKMMPSEYYARIGILTTAETRFQDTVSTLVERYLAAGRKAPSLTQLIEENPDIDVESLTVNAKLFTGLTSKEYLIQQGILCSDAELNPVLTPREDSSQIFESAPVLEEDEPKAENSANWQKEYQDRFEQNPTITFHGKVFVLSGFSAEDSRAVEKGIYKKGGLVRATVTVAADYLVMAPEGEDITAIHAAIKQKEQGNSITIIWKKDLESALNEETPVEEASVSLPVAATEESVQTAEEPSCSVLPAAIMPVAEFEIEGTCLKKYAGEETHVIIPDGVIEIGEEAFKNISRKVKKITVPEGVEKICYKAFYKCDSVQEIILPESLTEIEMGAFNRCKSLKDIRIPKNVKTIPANAFWECTALKKVDMHDEITLIDRYAFYHCESLQEVSIPQGVKFVAGSAFSGCLNLKKIVIPSSVKSIGGHAFWDTDCLEEVIFEEGIEEITIEKDGQICGPIFGKWIHEWVSNAVVNLPKSLKRIEPEEEFALSSKSVKKLLVYEGSYGEEFAKRSGLEYELILTEEQRREEQRRKAEEERRIREEEERRRQEEESRRRAEEERIRLEEERKIREEEERKRREEEERRRQERLEAARKEYDQLKEDINLQLKIISENKGWFGTAAKIRKAAQERLNMLQARLEKDFPAGRP